MSRALEAHTRESLQKEADEAIYARRNFAVEQERMIKESELNTEIAIEEKQKQIVEKQMETDVVRLENKHQLRDMEMESNIQLEAQKQKLIDLKSANEKQDADVKEYVLNATLNPYKDLEWKTLMAINPKGMNPGDNIALAFRELAEMLTKLATLTFHPNY
jgi:hypothetical protein